ncbi:hypothetical protein ARC310_01325 [Pantoea ananatis]|nr:hypothetical protein ARC310_01325 [Pantoea ananatis]PZD70103.1 hypothetical protein ARC311_00520 [Pantoea ananatis]
MNERLTTLLTIVILVGVATITKANAGQITMSNPQQETSEDGKRICIYSNSIYTFTLVTRSQRCPYSRTFDTDDSE